MLWSGVWMIKEFRMSLEEKLNGMTSGLADRNHGNIVFGACKRERNGF